MHQIVENSSNRLRNAIGSALITILLTVAAGGCHLSQGLAATHSQLGFDHDPTQDAAVRGVVVYSCATDCPLGNAMAPELARLADESSANGIVWVAIYPDELITADKVAAHQREFALSMPAFPDPTLALARANGITATPEVVVYAPGGLMVYRGRIDDSWDFIGTRRKAPKRRDLKDVLDQLQRGEVPTPRVTEPVGCLLPPV